MTTTQIDPTEPKVETPAWNATDPADSSTSARSSSRTRRRERAQRPDADSASTPNTSTSTSTGSTGTSRSHCPDPAAAELAFTGTLRVHLRGFAFVDADPEFTARPGHPTSAFVPPAMAKAMLSGDIVSVAAYLEDDGRATATSLTLIERTRTQLFGVLENSVAGGLQLRPDPHVGHGSWRVQEQDGIHAGQAALCTFAGARSVTVTDTFDDPTGGLALRQRILARHEIVEDYPAEVLAEVSAHQRSGRDLPRRDLRDLVTFTVDSDSSRDLDDALSVYPAGADGGLRVCVHISDVAAHIHPGSALDAEARRSGTSLYLPGWTRPMLPPQLSEDALSLLPGVDRDALTVEMRVTPDGEVSYADVYASTIRSNTRLSYDTAAAILAEQRPDGVTGDVVDALRWLRTAGARLGVQRARRGGVEARRVEPELTVHVVDDVATTVAQTPQNPANLLIERLMVAANESVAGWLVDRGLPGMFRNHPAPAVEAAPALEAFCAQVGYHPGFGAELTPLALAALSSQLDSAADDTAGTVWDVLLGFLGRAAYSPTATGHFGLASSGYLHFTSPIRRYADLVVHRIIHTFLDGARNGGDFDSSKDLTELATHLNTASGTAAKAESQVRKALWLVTLERRRVEDPTTTFTGRVSGLNTKGLFLTLEHSHVSGFLSTRNLPGRGWEPTVDGLALTSDSGQKIGYGERLLVRISSADVEAGALELVLADAPQRPARPTRDSGRDSRSGRGGPSGGQRRR